MSTLTSSGGPRLSVLQAQLDTWQRRLGRRPTVAELKSFIRRHRLTAAEVDALAAATRTPTPPPRTPGQVPAPPAAASSVGQLEASTTDDDWQDPDDPFAVPQEDTGASPPTEDPQVARFVQDVRDDWDRTSGQVARDDVTRLATRRGLDAEQLATSLDLLELLGVTWSTATSPSGSNGVEHPERPRAGYAERDLVGAYLARAGRIRLLNAEDEVRLGAAIRAGQDSAALLADEARAPRLSPGRRRQLDDVVLRGAQAHNDLVQANLRLVVSIARHTRYASCGVEFADRIQDGNIGLMHAANKFDATRGYKFSTYATWWIRQAIERGVADRGRTIRLPVYMHEKVLKLRRERARLLARHDREPTLEELAERMGEEPGTVAALLQHLQPTASLDAPVDTEADLTVGDLLSAKADVDGRRDPVDVVMAAARHRDLKAVMQLILTEREEYVIVQRYGLNGEEKTLDALGRDLSVTRERVRQIQSKAMSKLRECSVSRPLYEYLIDATRRDALVPARTPAEPGPQRRAQREPGRDAQLVSCDQNSAPGDGTGTVTP